MNPDVLRERFLSQTAGGIKNDSGHTALHALENESNIPVLCKQPVEQRDDGKNDNGGNDGPQNGGQHAGKACNMPSHKDGGIDCYGTGG